MIVAAVTALPLWSADMLPWEQIPLPENIVQSALHPDWVFCETPCDWRNQLASVFRPLVSDCSDAREAVLKIAGNMTAATGVYYSMERRKYNMNAMEALREKKVSCTGQSILLVCALRSVGIPARAVWVMTWNHVPGNHTWAEAWVDGQWQMIEFNEKDFNTPWVMESIGMLNTEKPAQRVYAVACADPSASDSEKTSSFLVEDVTERYMKLARQWYEKNGLLPEYQRILVDVTPRMAEPETVEILNPRGEVISCAQLPTVRDDVRRFASLVVPRSGRYILKTSFGIMKLASNDRPVHIVRLSREDFTPETRNRSSRQQHHVE